jgi:hypothetical protein
MNTNIFKKILKFFSAEVSTYSHVPALDQVVAEVLYSASESLMQVKILSLAYSNLHRARMEENSLNQKNFNIAWTLLLHGLMANSNFTNAVNEFGIYLSKSLSSKATT